jgi:hypothetical protein
MKRVQGGKKIICLALAMATVVPFAMTGCQSGSAKVTYGGATASTTNYSKAKPITLTVFSQTANFSGTQGGWFAKILNDKFKITLKIISGQGEGANLYTTRSAAGNLGDLIIYGSNIQNFTDSIKAGLLADMTPYLKTQGAYVSKTFPKAVARMKSDYGKGKYVYGLPNYVSTQKATDSSDGNDLIYGNYLIWSAYKKAGMPKINTLEDLLGAVQKMQKARPVGDNGKKTYGFSLFKDWDGDMMSNAKQYACVYGWDEWGFNLVNAKGDKMESILDKNGQYYRNLKFYFDANQKGLLDPDSYAQTQSEWATKIQNGQTLSCWWPWEAQPQFNTVARTSNSYKNTTTGVTGADGYVMIPIKDEKIISTGFQPAGANYEMAIGSQNPDKARTMALINWLYSPEGIETAYDGPKGVTWTTDKNGKNPKLTAFGKKAVNDASTKMPASAGGGTYQDGQDKIADFHCANENGTDPTLGQPYLYSGWKSYASAPTDLQKTWSKEIGGGAATVHAYLTKNKQIAVAPGTAIQTPVLSTTVATQENTVKAIIRKYSWQMVMATSQSEFNSDYNAMLSQAKQAGLASVDNAYKAQWEKLKAARAAAAKG